MNVFKIELNIYLLFLNWKKNPTKFLLFFKSALSYLLVSTGLERWITKPEICLLALKPFSFQKGPFFFVEFGALDGESRSNTLTFERFHNWEGLIAEGDPNSWAKVRCHCTQWTRYTHCCSINASNLMDLLHKSWHQYFLFMIT